MIMGTSHCSFSTFDWRNHLLVAVFPKTTLPLCSKIKSQQRKSFSPVHHPCCSSSSPMSLNCPQNHQKALPLHSFHCICYTVGQLHLLGRFLQHLNLATFASAGEPRFSAFQDAAPPPQPLSELPPFQQQG